MRSSKRFGSIPSRLLLVLFLFVPAACENPRGTADVEEAPHKARITLTQSGLKVPESAIHDPAADVYFVSNINGSPFGEDGKGFISRMRPDGVITELKWIDGSAPGVDLAAPKGMGLTVDHLVVADVDKVRKFDRTTGRPRGHVSIDRASFLNDIAVGAGDTVYVSDSGFGPGFSASGTDAIYTISRENEVRPLVRSADLGQPNGLCVDGADLLFVTWQRGTLERLRPDGSTETIATFPSNQLDGIVAARDGGWLVSSWSGSCIYRVSPEGEVTVAVSDLAAPADIGIDASRGVILIPFFNDARLDILRI